MGVVDPFVLDDVGGVRVRVLRAGQPVRDGSARRLERHHRRPCDYSRWIGGVVFVFVFAFAFAFEEDLAAVIVVVFVERDSTRGKERRRRAHQRLASRTSEPSLILSTSSRTINTSTTTPSVATEKLNNVRVYSTVYICQRGFLNLVLVPQVDHGTDDR
jgi:hypothetical protein